MLRRLQTYLYKNKLTRPKFYKVPYHAQYETRDFLSKSGEINRERNQRLEQLYNEYKNNIKKYK